MARSYLAPVDRHRGVAPVRCGTRVSLALRIVTRGSSLRDRAKPFIRSRICESCDKMAGKARRSKKVAICRPLRAEGRTRTGDPFITSLVPSFTTILLCSVLSGRLFRTPGPRYSVSIPHSEDATDAPSRVSRRRRVARHPPPPAAGGAGRPRAGRGG